MARREWPLRFQCGHEGCAETSNYRYQTKRDMMESFELKNFSNGRWRCVRHTRPDEVLKPGNLRRVTTITVEQKGDHRYLGHSGFVSGPGFKVFADDLPVGAQLIVSAEIWVPPAHGACPSSPDGRCQVDTSMESGSNNCFHCEQPMKRG